MPAEEEYLCDPCPRSVFCRPLRDFDVPTWKAAFSLWTEDGKKNGLTFQVILTMSQEGQVSTTIEDLTFGIVDTVDEYEGRVPSSVVSARLIERGRRR